MNATAQPRLYGFDSLRAFMLLLGVFFHAALPFVQFEISDYWPYQHEKTALFMDGLAAWLHLFRIPIFFIIAGFFAGLVLEKRGVRSFIVKKIKRIAWPFFLFWVLMTPLVVAAFIYLSDGTTNRLIDNTIQEWLHFNTIHYWFLYYLMAYYLITVLLVLIGKKLTMPWQKKPLSFTTEPTATKTQPTAAMVKPTATKTMSIEKKRATSRPKQICDSVLFMLLLLLSFWLSKDYKFGQIQASYSFIPDLKSTGYYACFYAIGWLLFKQKEMIKVIASKWKPAMLLLLILLPLYFLILNKLSKSPDNNTNNLLIWPLSWFLVWLHSYSFLAISFRKLNAFNKIIAYFSQSSYWIYMIHLPILLGLLILHQKMDLPIAGSYPLLVLLTLGFSVLSYELIAKKVRFLADIFYIKR